MTCTCGCDIWRVVTEPVPYGMGSAQMPVGDVCTNCGAPYEKSMDEEQEGGVPRAS